MAYTTIDNPGEYFNTKLHSGTGSSNAITGIGFQPDWTWIKCRNATEAHRVIDSVRGAEQEIYTNLEDEEFNEAQGLKSFDSDGFTLGTTPGYNGSGKTFVSWNWKKTATAGFDIVAYTGNGSARTISHSLSAVPSMMIVKSRSSANKPWGIYHHKNTSAPETDFLSLNNTNATADNSAYWNDTAPTSSVFTVGTTNDVNENGTTYIAYLFSEVKGYSKFGSYTGNGSTDGVFCFTGMKVGWLMIKRTDSANSWIIMDNKRNTFNPMGEELKAEVSDAGNDATRWDQLSNGFKLRNGSGAVNASGGTYIYMALAENPFVTSSGVPACAR